MKTGDVRHEKVKKNKRRLIAGIVALAIFLTTAVAGLVHHFGKKNKNNDNGRKDTDTSYYTNLNNLGADLETNLKPQSSANNVVTGNIDPNKIVKNPEGEYYTSSEALDLGTTLGTTIDTEDGKYIVDSTGKVNDNSQTGYEVEDNKGNTISSGTSSIPEGYAKQENGNLLPNGYMYSDNTYYGISGNILVNKGECISKETYNRLQVDLKNGTVFTTKPATTPEETTRVEETEETTRVEETEETTRTEETTQTPTTSGEYTIGGLTFKSKADYEQWVLQGYEGYSLVDGVMMSDEARVAYQKTLNK